MDFRFFRLTRLVAAAVLCAPVAPAQQNNPAPAPSLQAPAAPEVFLQAHMLMQEAEKLEKKADLSAAYVKLERARNLFDSIAHSFPSWQPSVIEYRRRRIREDMKRVWDSEMARRNATVDADTPPDLAVASPASPPTAVTTARDPGAIMQERLNGLQSRIDNLTKRNESLLRELGGREGELLRLKRELRDAREGESDLRTRLTDAKTKIATAGASERRKNESLTKRVAELENLLADATTQLAAANAKTESLVAELVQAYADIRERTAERDSLRQERDDLLALMNADGDRGADKLRIIAENQRLKKELETAKSAIETLKSEKEADREALATLREQLTSVQDELAAFQQENQDYRAQISALTARLDETSRRLAESAGAGLPESAAVAENGVLREIILQQMKQQAKRERAHENLMAELNRDGVLDSMRGLGVETDTLLRALNDMAAPVALTREQRGVMSNSGFEQFLTDNGVGELMVIQDSQALRGDAGSAPPESIAATGASTKDDLSPELKGYANAAEEFFRDGSWEEAENQFGKILLVEPKNIYALCNLGVVQLRRGKPDEAIVNLRKALAWEFDCEAAHHVLGVALMRRGLFDDAEESLHDCLKISPDNASAHYSLGLIALKRKHWNQAESELKQAIASDPSLGNAHLNLAILYAFRQKLDLADRHYRIALKNGADRSSDLDKLLNRNTVSSR